MKRELTVQPLYNGHGELYKYEVLADELGFSSHELYFKETELPISVWVANHLDMISGLKTQPPIKLTRPYRQVAYQYTPSPEQGKMIAQQISHDVAKGTVLEAGLRALVDFGPLELSNEVSDDPDKMLICAVTYLGNNRFDNHFFKGGSLIVKNTNGNEVQRGFSPSTATVFVKGYLDSWCTALREKLHANEVGFEDHNGQYVPLCHISQLVWGGRPPLKTSSWISQTVLSEPSDITRIKLALFMILSYYAKDIEVQCKTPTIERFYGLANHFAGSCKPCLNKQFLDYLESEPNFFLYPFTKVLRDYQIKRPWNDVKLCLDDESVYLVVAGDQRAKGYHRDAMAAITQLEDELNHGHLSSTQTTTFDPKNFKRRF